MTATTRKQIEAAAAALNLTISEVSTKRVEILPLMDEWNDADRSATWAAAEELRAALGWGEMIQAGWGGVTIHRTARLGYNR